MWVIGRSASSLRPLSMTATPIPAPVRFELQAAAAARHLRMLIRARLMDELHNNMRRGVPIDVVQIVGDLWVTCVNEAGKQRAGKKFENSHCFLPCSSCLRTHI